MFELGFAAVRSSSLWLDLSLVVGSFILLLTLRAHQSHPNLQCQTRIMSPISFFLSFFLS